jgi:hypothetical protein
MGDSFTKAREGMSCVEPEVLLTADTTARQ